MVTMEVNGITISAETVKAANKMARAEEKKQHVAAQQRDEYLDIGINTQWRGLPLS